MNIYNLTITSLHTPTGSLKKLAERLIFNCRSRKCSNLDSCFTFSRSMNIITTTQYIHHQLTHPPVPYSPVTITTLNLSSRSTSPLRNRFKQLWNEKVVSPKVSSI